MDASSEISIKSPKEDGFVDHVFRFDKDTKSTLLNIGQYAALAVIPVVAMNKTMQRFVPDADDDKGTFEIVVEILVQILVIFWGMFFTHRLITFVPTHSDTPYPRMDVTSVILATLVIVLSLQSKLGNKMGILSDRVSVLVMGDGGDGGKGHAQPQKRQGGGSTAVSSLPSSAPHQPQQTQSPQQQPFYPPPQPIDSVGAANEYTSGGYASFQ